MRALLAAWLLAAALVPAGRAFAQGTAPARFRALYEAEIRQLDGEELLEDEPIWLCTSGAPGPASDDAFWPPAWSLVGRDASGRTHGQVAAETSSALSPAGASDGTLLPRAFELGQTFGFYDPTNRYPLWGTNNSIPQGVWEIHALEGDTARVLARIRVVPAPGAERSVRDGLARAARLAKSLGRPADAAQLYAAIYQRYPRTAYLSALYWGEWDVREHTRFAHDPGRWMEEVFALFHDSCFGVAALDRWTRDVGPEEARPILRKLVGIYPDTPLSRAAARYL